MKSQLLELLTGLFAIAKKCANKWHPRREDLSRADATTPWLLANFSLLASVLPTSHHS
jgi:hypothetical protein